MPPPPDLLQMSLYIEEGNISIFLKVKSYPQKSKTCLKAPCFILKAHNYLVSIYIFFLNVYFGFTVHYVLRHVFNYLEKVVRVY